MIARSNPTLAVGAPYGKGRACGIGNPRVICVRYMRRKSGSCSSADTVTPASDLVDQDPRFQDFGIAYEPPHLRVPTYGRLFKSPMSAHVLAPLFSDIESEDYSAKVGFTQPRADLVIPSLKLIIEAKFARATDSLKEIQRQLAQDAAMYFPQGGQYDRMIAFVWDNAARTEEHATLIQGLERLERIAGVIVLSRPSKMHAPPVSPASPTDGGVAS